MAASFDLLRRIDLLGALLWRAGRQVGQAMFLLASAAPGLLDWRGGRGFYLRQILSQQLYFTAVQAWWLVTLAGFVFGALAVLPLNAFGVKLVSVQAQVLEMVVFHQLVPFVTALIVIGRSGNAITAELGDMQAHGVGESLQAMGIDPYRLLILPRLLGLAISLVVLTLWGNVGAVVGAGVFDALLGVAGFWRIAYACASIIDLADVMLTGLMAAAYGLAIGLVHCHFGLAGASNVDTERNLPRAFVRAFLACIALTVLFALLRR